MMKLIRSILRWIASLLVLGGILALAYYFFSKKEILNALISNTIVRSSMPVLKNMGLAVCAIFLGLLVFMLSMKLSSVIRRNEREKNAELRQREKENKEENKRLQREAEDARKEAEEAKKEAEKMKQTLMDGEESKNA